MKIATVTFHKALNYGAVLQAAALCRAINKLGHEAEILNYDNKIISSCYDIIKTDSAAALVKSFLSMGSSIRKHKVFAEFLKKQCKLSRDISRAELNNIEQEYDKFITGSDQVYNYELTGTDGTYLLDFVKDKSKRLSYAASFGFSEIPPNKLEFYQVNLAAMKHLSVREKTGADIIKKAVSREAVVDLDPVFLLEKNDWQKMMVQKENEPYIFIYMPSDTPVAYEYAKKLSVVKNMKIINIAYDKSFLHPELNVGECRLSASPEEFITLINNASYVVTSSFHAVAFSLILNKDFYVAVKANRGSRITDLLDKAGINDRYIKDSEPFEGKTINWQQVNDKIGELRKQSINNLKHSLEN